MTTSFTYNVAFSSTGDVGGKTAITIAPGAVDTSTSLELPGRGFISYGEFYNKNVLTLLENFAKNTPPVAPTVGQWWFDLANKKMRVYDGTNISDPSHMGWTTLVTNDSCSDALGNIHYGCGSLNSVTTGTANTAFGKNALFTDTAGASNTAVGSSALYLNTLGNYNTAFGTNALFSNTTASNNTAVGYFALTSNSTGTNNTAVGFEAMQTTSVGSSNTAVGVQAMFSNTSGGSNTAVGYTALYTNSTGTNNSAVGYFALRGNTTGSFNTAFGNGALQSNTTASNNTAVGYNALNLNTTGTSNVAVGYQALNLNTTGINNTAVGYGSLGANSSGGNNNAFGLTALALNATGSFNSAFGDYALGANTTGTNNVAVGSAALHANTTGNNNVAVGLDAMNASTSGANNTAVGTYAMLNATTGSSNVAVGENAFANLTTGSNNVIVGVSTGLGITTGSGNTIIGSGIGGLYTNLTNNIILASGGVTRLQHDATTLSVTGAGGVQAAHYVSTDGAQVQFGGNALAGYYQDATNTAIRTITTSGLVYVQSNSGSTTYTTTGAFAGANPPVMQVNGRLQLINQAVNGDQATTLDQVNTLITNAAAVTVPPGTIIAFAGTAAPTGFLLCPPSPLTWPVSSYPALARAVGLNWGYGTPVSSTALVGSTMYMIVVVGNTNWNSIGLVGTAAPGVVFTASGAAAGTGTATTTFGMPYVPADFTLGNSGGIYAVGTMTSGQVINHTHPYTVVSAAAPQSGSSTNCYFQATTVQTGNPPTGGPNNLAANMRIIYCVKT